MIQVRDLRVDYDDVCAVREVSFAVGPGDVYGLIGPNGAGKTTTLRALVGLLEPTYGDILLNGFDLTTHREEAVRHVGFMPDFAPVYDELSVEDFLDLFAASYFIPRDQRDELITQCLALVDLSAKRAAPTGTLSRGMRQRLILAKTLLPDPQIVLLDEPASGMDPHGRILLKQILGTLAEMGKAIIISSHILTELSEFCTSVGVMERGQLVVSGRIEAVAAQVLGRREVALEVLADPERCAAVLSALPGVSGVRQEACGLTFDFLGDREAECRVLEALVAQGVRVVSYGRKKDNLEDVFLKIGAKEVS